MLDVFAKPLSELERIPRHLRVRAVAEILIRDAFPAHDRANRLCVGTTLHLVVMGGQTQWLKHAWGMHFANDPFSNTELRKIFQRLAKAAGPVGRA
jgi:hypothetical protein